jgi:hypothetical protein
LRHLTETIDHINSVKLGLEWSNARDNLLACGISEQENCIKVFLDVCSEDSVREFTTDVCGCDCIQFFEYVNREADFSDANGGPACVNDLP